MNIDFPAASYWIYSFSCMDCLMLKRKVKKLAMECVRRSCLIWLAKAYIEEQSDSRKKFLQKSYNNHF